MLKHRYTKLTEQFALSFGIPPSILDELAVSLGRIDTQSIRNEIIGELFRFADSITINVITPWTIESAKGIDDMYKVFGNPRSTLPVIVIFNGVTVGIHEFTEELIFGILSITSFSDAFAFYLEDTMNNLNLIPITLEDLQDNYIGNYPNRRYSATLPIDNITFDTPDVIQGVITASNWIGRDPHDFIQDIRDRSKGNIILDFTNPTQPIIGYSHVHLFQKKKDKK